MKRRIYYFTGTGISMRAARIIAQKPGDTEIISMRTDPADYPASDCDIVVFIYPVCHRAMPAPAVSFVKKLDISPRAYVFVIAMSSLICGIACEKLAGILINGTEAILHSTEETRNDLMEFWKRIISF